jgi:hypothetical protein
LTPPTPCSTNHLHSGIRSVDGDYDDGTDIGKTIDKVRRRCAGVELDDIPLCAECEAQGGVEEPAANFNSELEVEETQKQCPSHDGLDSLREAIPRRAPRRPKVKGATGFESELERFINRSSTGYHDLFGPNVNLF